MSERIEKIIKEYHRMKKERNCLEHQIRNFRGISEKEMIDSMNFHSPEGERVQTSNISNKPASIALNYHEKMERINQEWYEHLCWMRRSVSLRLRSQPSVVICRSS